MWLFSVHQLQRIEQLTLMALTTVKEPYWTQVKMDFLFFCTWKHSKKNIQICHIFKLLNRTAWLIWSSSPLSLMLLFWLVIGSTLKTYIWSLAALVLIISKVNHDWARVFSVYVIRNGVIVWWGFCLEAYQPKCPLSTFVPAVFFSYEQIITLGDFANSHDWRVWGGWSVWWSRHHLSDVASLTNKMSFQTVFLGIDFQGLFCNREKNYYWYNWNMLTFLYKTTNSTFDTICLEGWQRGDAPS